MTAVTRTDRAARIHRSRWPAVEVPDVGVPEYLLDHPAARADAPAVIDGPSGRTLTYGDLRRERAPVRARAGRPRVRRAGTSSRSSRRTCPSGSSAASGR